MLTSTVVYWTNQWEVWSQLDVNKKRTYEQLLSCSKAIIQKNTPEALKLQVKPYRLGAFDTIRHIANHKPFLFLDSVFCEQRLVRIIHTLL